MPDALVLLPSGIALAVAVSAWMFRSPKETAAELRSDLLALGQRVATLEGAINAMGREYAGNHARHDQALIALTNAVTKLTDRFDAYMGERNGSHRRG